MNDPSWHRKVLIVEDRKAISNLLHALLVEADCEREGAARGRQALALTPRERFDVVIVDLRCDEPPSPSFTAAISELYPALTGRVLAITVEAADQKTLDWLESSCLPVARPGDLPCELWTTLRALLDLRRFTS